MIPLFRPKFRVQECLDSISNSLESGWTGQGAITEKFESEWGLFTSTRNNIFLNSASAAIHLALESLKIANSWQLTSEIISTPLTFVSTNHAIHWSGMQPVFADVDESLCLSPESVIKNISSRTKAVIFVAMGGNSSNLSEIKLICQNYGLKLIIDAAHSAGSRENGIDLGNQADATCYSFQAVKNLPTADSGLLHMYNDEAFEIARKLAWLGISESTFSRTKSTSYKWEYGVDFIGFKDNGNSIMGNLALVGLKYLDVDNIRRREIAKTYSTLLTNNKSLKIVTHKNAEETSQHLFQVITPFRDLMTKNLTKNEIGFGVHYKSNTEFAMYDKFKAATPIATLLSQQILSLPLFLEITEAEQIKIASALEI